MAIWPVSRDFAAKITVRFLCEARDDLKISPIYPTRVRATNWSLDTILKNINNNSYMYNLIKERGIRFRKRCIPFQRKVKHEIWQKPLGIIYRYASDHFFPLQMIDFNIAFQQITSNLSFARQYLLRPSYKIIRNGVLSSARSRYKLNFPLPRQHGSVACKHVLCWATEPLISVTVAVQGAK